MRCAEQGKVGETVLFSSSAIIHSLQVKKLPDWHGLTRRGVERREQVSPQRKNKTVFSQKVYAGADQEGSAPSQDKKARLRAILRLRFRNTGVKRI